MTKMATMPIYGKNLQKSFSLEPIGQYRWNLVFRSTLVLDAFVWENTKMVDYSESIDIYDIQVGIYIVH